MTDILVRICVGMCGVYAIFNGTTSLTYSDHEWQCWVAVLLGLITILRALGVL